MARTRIASGEESGLDCREIDSSLSSSSSGNMVVVLEGSKGSVACSVLSESTLRLRACIRLSIAVKSV